MSEFNFRSLKKDREEILDPELKKFQELSETIENIQKESPLEYYAQSRKKIYQDIEEITKLYEECRKKTIPFINKGDTTCKAYNRAKTMEEMWNRSIFYLYRTLLRETELNPLNITLITLDEVVRFKEKNNKECLNILFSRLELERNQKNREIILKYIQEIIKEELP